MLLLVIANLHYRKHQQRCTIQKALWPFFRQVVEIVDSCRNEIEQHGVENERPNDLLLRHKVTLFGTFDVTDFLLECKLNQHLSGIILAGAMAPRFSKWPPFVLAGGRYGPHFLKKGPNILGEGHNLFCICFYGFKNFGIFYNFAIFVLLPAHGK